MFERNGVFMNVKKMPISMLTFIILNDKEDLAVRKDANVELRRRLKNVGWKCRDLLYKEYEIIRRRGSDINEYLICDTPSLQKLMEVYFLYSYDTSGNSRMLLFSERHLCNNMTFCSKFFERICSLEINRIEKRMDGVVDDEKVRLYIFKKALEKRKTDLLLNREMYFPRTEILEFNEALQYIGGEHMLNFGYNVSSEELLKIESSKLKKLKYELLDIINYCVEDELLLQSLYGLKIVISDSQKLRKQKKILLKQMNSDINIDYNSDTMNKVFSKVRSSVAL